MSKALDQLSRVLGPLITISTLLWTTFFLSDGLDQAIVGIRILPKTVSFGRPTISDHGTAILVNILLASLLPLQHTLMARPASQRIFARLSPLCFTLASFAAEAAVFLFWTPLPRVLFTLPSPLGSVFLFAPVLGLALIFWSIHVLDASVQNPPTIPQDASCPVAPAPRELSTDSVYGLVRHPIMAGFFVIFWAGAALTEGRLLLAAVWTIYVLVAVPLLEEPDLRAAVGPDVYDRYTAKVDARYIPRLNALVRRWRKTEVKHE